MVGCDNPTSQRTFHLARGKGTADAMCLRSKPLQVQAMVRYPHPNDNYLRALAVMAGVGDPINLLLHQLPLESVWTSPAFIPID